MWRPHGVGAAWRGVSWLEVESRLHSAGAVQMQLHVFTGNTAAIRFYEAIGYAQTGVAENFYAQNLHALLYRKTLRKA